MKRFRSKVDPILAVLGIACTIAIGSAIIPAITLQPGREAWLLVMVLIASEGLLLSIFLFTYYEVDGNSLLVRSGPLHWTIPISEIDAIEPSNSLMSGPALSFSRWKIRYSRGKTLLISPKLSREFFLAINKNPNHF